MRAWLALAMIVPLVAGCTSPGSTPGIITPNSDGASAPSATPSAAPPASSGGNASAPATPAAPGSSAPPAPNSTAPNATSPPAAWASPDAAKIRPGVQVISPGGQCTSNFVFTSLDNRSAYIGLAAHCVVGQKIGDAVEIGPGIAKGTIAYSSWYVTGHSDPGAAGSEAGSTCSHENDSSTCAYNDFALIAIDNATRAVVSPSMRHFGGPIALAATGATQPLDKVLTYGNSELRMGVDQSSWKEGYVVDHSDAWTISVATLTPGVPGDSGSGVMTGDGKALGLFVTLNGDGTGGVTSLDKAIAWAAEHGHLQVQLATAPLLDPGLLPPV